MTTIMKKHSEDYIQSQFHIWLWNYYPLTRQLCYHIPNGGLRGVREAVKLKGLGVVAGIPDYHIAIPARGYSSLYIEFKEPGANMNTEHVRHQTEVQSKLIEAGNKVVVCTSLESGKATALEYLKDTGYLSI